MTLSHTLNPVYVFAAARGHPQAQSDLAVGFLRLADAEEDHDLASEYLAVAELIAELACAHGRPYDLAVKGGVLVARSLHLGVVDPVRSLDYRDQAEKLFDAVEDSGDTQALGIVAYAVNHLADVDPDDDGASDRLNRLIAALPPADAQLLRETVRTVEREAQAERQ